MLGGHDPDRSEQQILHGYRASRATPASSIARFMDGVLDRRGGGNRLPGRLVIGQERAVLRVAASEHRIAERPRQAGDVLQRASFHPPLEQRTAKFTVEVDKKQIVTRAQDLSEVQVAWHRMRWPARSQPRSDVECASSLSRPARSVVACALTGSGNVSIAPPGADRASRRRACECAGASTVVTSLTSGVGSQLPQVTNRDDLIVRGQDLFHSRATHNFRRAQHHGAGAA